MGYYIETTNGAFTGKADHFVEEHGAVRIEPEFIEPSTGEVAVCVVENGPFDAALVVYDRAEFAVASNLLDYRRKTFLRMKRETVAKLGPAEYAHFVGVDVL
jgi:hypothetical protein